MKAKSARHLHLSARYSALVEALLSRDRTHALAFNVGATAAAVDQGTVGCQLHYYLALAGCAERKIASAEGEQMSWRHPHAKRATLTRPCRGRQVPDRGPVRRVRTTPRNMQLQTLS